MSLKLIQQQKLLQKLSPQQIQLMKLLQIPAIGLEQRIKEELEINPALEEGDMTTDEAETAEKEEELFSNDESEEVEGFEDKEHAREDFNLDEYIDDDEIPSYKLNVKNTGEDDERREIPVSGSVSFQDQLLSQLGLRIMDDTEYRIAEFLIGNMDDDGYMRRELAALVDDLAFTQNINTTEAQLLGLLKQIQDFDPPGVGARNLQECLSIQLRRKYLDTHDPVIKTALLIIDQSMEEFSKKHFEKIARKLDLDSEEGDEELLKNAIHEILKLNPKPGNSMSEGQKSIQHVIPDFILSDNDGEPELSLYSRNLPELRISRGYIQMLEEYSKSKLQEKSKKEAVQFVKSKIDAAKWFIDALQQRNITLITVMQCIFEYQRDYFTDGDETRLKPMILKDIAEKLGLDISTISRVANSKYIQTRFGTFPLKYFFSESLSNEAGEEVSTREVKKILEDCISAEKKSKPLTDDKLAKILKERGYNIARRTVAKYREQLNIPVARMRKEI